MAKKRTSEPVQVSGPAAEWLAETIRFLQHYQAAALKARDRAMYAARIVDDPKFRQDAEYQRSSERQIRFLLNHAHHWAKRMAREGRNGG